MTDVSIVGLLKRIPIYLKGKLPSLTAIPVIAGPMNAAAVNRMMTNQRIPHLAFIGISQVQNGVGGAVHYHANFGIYVAMGGNLDRDEHCINLLTVLAALLVGANRADAGPGLNVPDTGEILIAGMANLYSAEIDAKGVSLYGLTFSVETFLGDNIFEGDLDVFDQVVHYALNGPDDVVLVPATGMDTASEAIDGEP